MLKTVSNDGKVHILHDVQECEQVRTTVNIVIEILDIPMTKEEKREAKRYKEARDLDNWNIEPYISALCFGYLFKQHYMICWRPAETDPPQIPTLSKSNLIPITYEAIPAYREFTNDYIDSKFIQRVDRMARYCEWENRDEEKMVRFFRYVMRNGPVLARKFGVVVPSNKKDDAGQFIAKLLPKNRQFV